MLDSAAKAFFHLLARSGVLKNLASRYGMRKPTSFARRFIAGETVDEAIDAARAVEAQRPAADARLPRRERHQRWRKPTPPRATTCEIIDAIIASGIERNLSLKLTQLGLDVDRASAVDNLRRILDARRRASSSASTWRTRATPT